MKLIVVTVYFFPNGRLLKMVFLFSINFNNLIIYEKSSRKTQISLIYDIKLVKTYKSDQDYKQEYTIRH